MTEPLDAVRRAEIEAILTRPRQVMRAGQWDTALAGQWDADAAVAIRDLLDEIERLQAGVGELVEGLDALLKHLEILLDRDQRREPLLREWLAFNHHDAPDLAARTRAELGDERDE